jgi:hypothetical protein
MRLERDAGVGRRVVPQAKCYSKKASEVIRMLLLEA